MWRGHVCVYPDEWKGLAVGDSVWVYKDSKPFALATVIGGGHGDGNLYTVQYQDQSQYTVKRHRIVNIHRNALIVTTHTHHYRRLAFTHIAQWAHSALQHNHQDHVIEIGCAEGDTTMTLLKAKCTHLIAVDKSELCVEITAKKVQELRDQQDQGSDVKVTVKCLDIFNADWTKEFAFNEPLDTEQDSKLKRTVVFMDINGNRELPAVLKALHLVEKLLPECSLVVVKSSLLAKELEADPTCFERLYKEYTI